MGKVFTSERWNWSNSLQKASYKVTNFHSNKSHDNKSELTTTYDLHTLS